ncbi:MAG: phage Gp37/Gp68 family protein [Azoarcus sp.]|jgi:protein gp37|nr:phage Gp37/Gp68 family protein [Azoarcus sp.]
MGKDTKIAWARHTFNPWYGCTKISPGCAHCYAEGWAKRSGLVEWGAARRRSSDAYWQQPLRWNEEAELVGRRASVFCASLADVFDEEVPDEWRLDLLTLIKRTPWLTWLLLTKRIGAMERFTERVGLGKTLPLMYDNVWLGITVTSHAEAERDIPKLLDTFVGHRFVSIEPMLGAVMPQCLMGIGGDGSYHYLDALAGHYYIRPKPTPWCKVEWVIAGTESGPHARRDPAMLNWVRTLRDACKYAGTPFMWKQDTINGKTLVLPPLDGVVWNQSPFGVVERAGK